jgi:hypothetical protein
MAFQTVKHPDGTSGYNTAVMDKVAQHVNTHGTWYAQDNGDGDSWNVWVVIQYDNTEYHITWTVWQSNGFIRGVY